MSEDVASGSRIAGGREQALAETFVLLADTLVDDYDVVDLLDRLVAACVNLLTVDAAGLLLDDQRGNLAVVASTNDNPRLLDVLQIQSSEGPCLDCVRTGSVIASAELTSDADDRWPRFRLAAIEAGYGSVVAIPLRLREQTIGGLTMLRSQAEPVPPGDQRLAQALADVATIGILQRRSAHRSTILAEQLQHALNSRVVIEQAKGVLAEHNKLSMEDAFEALRRYSRAHNAKLSDVALSIVRGALDAGSLVQRPSR
jgi:transcriptional regulator with GAF, ATPase, and Fis domain